MIALDPRRRTIALVVIFGLMVVFGLAGAYCIDQGRPVVATLADTADQALKIKSAAVAVESARRLAATGHEAEASRLLGEVIETIKTVGSAEPSESRRATIAAVAPLAEDFARRFAPESGAALAAALAEFGAVQSRDVLEAEVQGSASILNAAALYVVLLIIVLGAAIGAALLGLREIR